MHHDIRLEGSGYLALVHPNGQTIEIREPGTLEVDFLYERLMQNNSLATKYLTFLWDKTFANIKVAQEEGISLVSAMELQSTGANSGKLQIIGADPQKLNPILCEKLDFRWSGGGQRSYVIQVLNLYDQVIYSESVDQPTFSLSLSDPRLINDQVFTDSQVFSLVIYAADNPNITSWRYGFAPLRGQQAESVDAELQFFKDALAPLNLVDGLIFATYFEQRGLMIDALTIYEGMINKAPDTVDFALLYGNFITRNLKKNFGRGL